MKKYIRLLCLVFVVFITLFYVSSFASIQRKDSVEDDLFFDHKKLMDLVIVLEKRLFEQNSYVSPNSMNYIHKAIEKMKSCSSKENGFKVMLVEEKNGEGSKVCKEHVMAYCNQALEMYNPQADSFNSMVYFIRGMSYLYVGDYYKVVEDMSSAIELNSSLLKGVYSICYIIRGLAYYNLGIFDRAIDDFDSGFKLDDKLTYFDEGLFYFFKAGAYAGLSKFKKAIENHDIALGLENEHIDFIRSRIYCQKGFIYNALGEYKKAIDNYSASLEIDDLYNLKFRCMTYVKRGDSYLLIGEHKRSIDDFSRVISNSQDNCAHVAKKQGVYVRSDAYFQRANCYMALKEHEKVIKDISNLILLAKKGESNKPLSDLYYSRAVMHYIVKDFDKAISDYKLSLSLYDIVKNMHYRPRVLKELSLVINDKSKNEEPLSSEDYYFLAEERYYNCFSNASSVNEHKECAAKVISYCDLSFELDDVWLKEKMFFYFIRGISHATLLKYDEFLRDFNELRMIYNREKKPNTYYMVESMEEMLKELNSLSTRKEKDANEL